MLKHILVPALVLVLLALLAFLYFEGSNLFAPTASTPGAAVQASSQPVSATVSLDDPTSLPSSVPAGDIVPFSFTVRNGDAAMTGAQYKVSVTWSTGESDVIDENVLTLAPGQSTTIQEALKFEVAKETAHVTVEFEHGGPQLTFTLPRQ